MRTLSKIIGFIFVFWALIVVFSSSLLSALKDHKFGKTVIETYDSAFSNQNQHTRLLHIRQAGMTALEALLILPVGHYGAPLIEYWQ